MTCKRIRRKLEKQAAKSEFHDFCQTKCSPTSVALEERVYSPPSNPKPVTTHFDGLVVSIKSRHKNYDNWHDDVGIIPWRRMTSQNAALMFLSKFLFEYFSGSTTQPSTFYSPHESWDADRYTPPYNDKHIPSPSTLMNPREIGPVYRYGKR